VSFRLAWVTDPHLDHAQVAALTRHVKQLRDKSPDAVLVTGDFATAPRLPKWLRAYHRFAERPVYFILGNHDFWGGSIGETRARVREEVAREPGITWLTESGPVRLGRTVLVGHDGWYDARTGDWESRRVRMQDWELVEDLREAGSHEDLVGRIRALADEAAAALLPKVEDAAQAGTSVLIATHVPPWPLPPPRAHPIDPAGDAIAPWYVARQLGHSLERIAERHPRVAFRVVAGHTHVRRRAIVVRDNLRCDVGHARYGAPAIEDILELA
jgi:predicted phosphohydrolase